MITYNRSYYTELSLSTLLSSCDDTMRVWIWHNGNDPGTLRVVSALRHHPKVSNFFHSPTNRKLTDATNWLWANSSSQYVAKVDDDILVPDNWLEPLRSPAEADTTVGCVSAWTFPLSDFDPVLSHHKIRTLSTGTQLMCHPWVGGGCYVMPRQCVLDGGPLKPDQSFAKYLTKLSWRGWTHGWALPLVTADHMDDPRASHSMIRTDEDLQHNLPLTAAKGGVSTVEEWDSLLRKTALDIQRSKSRPGRAFALRSALYRMGLGRLARVDV